MRKGLPLFGVAATALLLSASCNHAATPDIYWDTSPDTLIIRYWEAVRYCCHDADNVIPPLQIWGD